QIADAFDLIVCSAEENVMKPDPEIYRRALSRLNRKPGEAVFIDDNQENVATAQSLGMKAIRYQEGLELPAALRQMGVEVPDAAEAQHDGGTYHA
ncbi:MAG TPA: HAD-IA family hydrolase, partial [Candidatus Binatia bacterium]|nr:HAD-IA family hydrolase [Candidatus Binatia bacterium]